jgi:PKD repeat protein
MRRGIYTVSLTVYGPGGSDLESKKDYVAVEPGGAIPLMLLLDEDE